MSYKKKEKETLKVKSGVSRPGSINPEAVEQFRQKRKGVLPPEDYINGILAGDRSVLGQAITVIESVLPEHQDLGREIIKGCLPHSGNSVRIGITGVPGVGKSTFIEALGSIITGQEKKLAVLAIDPSSERSGGSILGDKTRMEDLSAHPNAFIRPSPSGGTLGGVARKTRESIILCESAGYEVIFIETVGVGQSETAVNSMVDFFLLLMLAGAGDELQGIKRGIMEMADAIAITKADGINKERAERAKSEYQNALHLFPASESGWTPRVVCSSAIDNTGLQEIWDLTGEYLDVCRQNNYFSTRRARQAKYWMYEFIHESLSSDFYGHEDIRLKLESLEKEVLEGQKSSFHAATEILKLYRKS